MFLLFTCSRIKLILILMCFILWLDLNVSTNIFDDLFSTNITVGSVCQGDDRPAGGIIAEVSSSEGILVFA
jgi:hypothetical protein